MGAVPRAGARCKVQPAGSERGNRPIAPSAWARVHAPPRSARPCTVLRPRAAPAQVVAIMGYLDDRTRHANGALVLSIARVFLSITQKLPPQYRDLHNQVRTCEPSSRCGARSCGQSPTGCGAPRSAQRSAAVVGGGHVRQPCECEWPTGQPLIAARSTGGSRSRCSPPPCPAASKYQS